MKKKIMTVIGVCVMALTMLVIPAMTAKAQDIGLPPEGYNASGKYPAGKVSNYYYYSTETHSQRKLVVYTPPGYSTNQKYPVVYSIHGIDNTPESIFRSWGADANLVADNLIGSGQIEPVIIVAWDNNNINCHNELMNNVLPYVEKTFPVIKDADHRAVYGYSMGGGYAFAEVMGNLDTFHHLSPTSALPMNHPSDDQMFQKGSANVKNQLKTLVLSCGTADWCGFYPSNLATHNYCVQYNIPHYWMSVQGGNHDSKVWSPAMYYLLKYAFPKGTNGNQGGQTQPEVQPQPTPSTNLQHASVADGTYYIKNVNANKYLSVAGNQAAAGTNVELSSYQGSDGQKWKVTNTADGYITLTSAVGNFMLDVANGSAEDGANIGIYHAYSGDAQKFAVCKTNTANTYVLTTKASAEGKVLDANQKGIKDGTNIIQWTYNGQANQQFVFEPVADQGNQGGQTQPEIKPETQPEKPVTEGKLDVKYQINSWGSGYQVSFKIENQTKGEVNGWTLQVKKSDIKISTSWNVNIKESGDSYVIKPVSWNAKIPAGQCVEFGVQGEGTIGNTISCILE